MGLQRPYVPVNWSSRDLLNIPMGIQQLQSGSERISSIYIEAPITNTGPVFVGGQDLTILPNGIRLDPGDGVSVAIDDINKVFVYDPLGTALQAITYQIFQ